MRGSSSPPKGIVGNKGEGYASKSEIAIGGWRGGRNVGSDEKRRREMKKREREEPLRSDIRPASTLRPRIKKARVERGRGGAKGGAQQQYKGGERRRVNGQGFSFGKSRGDRGGSVRHSAPLQKIRREEKDT